MKELEGIHPAIIEKLRTSGGFTDEEIIKALSCFEKRHKKKEFLVMAGPLTSVSSLNH